MRDYGIDPGRVERAARLYASNDAASQALGIVPRSFSRLCRRYGIETPYARRRRQRQEARDNGSGAGAEPAATGDSRPQTTEKQR